MRTFRNRRQAGRMLGEAVRVKGWADPVVLALPRGGVPVGAEIAAELEAPLDVILVRKLRAPGFPERGVGAIVETPTPQVMLDPGALARGGPSEDDLHAEKIRQLEVIDRWRKIYRQGRSPVDMEGRTLIVVDDGVATGGTARAALLALARSGAARIVLAVPVAASRVVDQLTPLADEVICLSAPENVRAVEDHFDEFAQVSDDDVIEFLLRSADRAGTGAG